MKSLTLFLTLYFTLLLFPQGLQAQVDPDIVWKEIETEEAYWLYDAKHQELVEYYIWQFKKAKKPLLKLFKEAPRKMTIIISDQTDQANGSARVTPHPIINVFPVMPSSSSSIGEFKNSVYEIMGHEYTHILNMEPVHGFITPLYWIFGSIAHPNMILPRWYTEGLAVYTESKYSQNGGRLNSQYVQGLARSLTLEKRWDKYPLSQLNDYQPDWLGGSRAYIFGGMLWDSIVRDGGSKIVEKFNQSYSRRIPYFLDGVISDQLGRDYDEQLSRAYKFWEKRAQKQIDIVSTQAHLAGRLLRRTSESDVSPSISPDGEWLVFISRNMQSRGDINIILRHPKKRFLGYKPITIEKNTSAQSIAWHPAATGFVYEKLDFYDFYYQFYDLYFYDLRTRKSIRLTRGQRAHHACFSPTGSELYYLQNISGTKQIVSMNLKNKSTKVIYKGSIGDDLRFLSCASKKSLLFVEQKPNTDPHIAKIDLSNDQKSIFFNEVPVNYLKWTSKGLLFSSRMSGIENLYLVENPFHQFKFRAITNSKTRSTQGDLDPLVDDLYYSQFTAKGPRIFNLKGAQWESLPDRPPQVQPIVKYSRQGETSAKKETRETASTLKSSSFSPWRYLYPNHWIPFLFILDGGTLYQASTSAGDPLGINSYTILGQWDTLTKKPSASFSYFNNSTPVTLGLGVSEVNSFFFATRDTLHFTNYTALMNWRVWFKKRLQLMMKWNYSRMTLTSFDLLRQGPQVQLSYSNVGRATNLVSPESGWNAQIGHKTYLSTLGNTSYEETYAHLGSYWSSIFPKRHTFYLSLNGSHAPLLNFNGSTFFATSTLGGPFLNINAANTSFLQRGYPTGTFLAKSIANANAEYRFPLFSVFRGWTGPPLFFKNLNGRFVFDATTLDGRSSSVSAVNGLKRAEFGHQWFTGYGMEVDANVNMGFHIPVTFTLGLYYGENRDSFGGFTTFFNVRL